MRGAYILPADGPLGPIEAWRSPDDWLSAVEAALATPEGEAIRRAARIGRRRLMAIAAAEAAAADQGTGRNSARSAATIAAALRICERTVGRARAALAALGASITVARGRYLRARERAATGRLRAASTRALTYPHGFRRGAGIIRPVSKMSINVSNPPSRRISRSRMVGKRRPAPLARQKQAAELARRMPWTAPDWRDTDRHRHVGRLIGILDRLGVPVTTTAARILGAIERENAAAARTVPDPGTQRDPLAVFAWLLAPAVPALTSEPVGIDAALAAAGHPPRRPAPPRCPPHRFDPVSGWCVHGCGVRDDALFREDAA